MTDFEKWVIPRKGWAWGLSPQYESCYGQWPSFSPQYNFSTLKVVQGMTGKLSSPNMELFLQVEIYGICSLISWHWYQKYINMWLTPFGHLQGGPYVQKMVKLGFIWLTAMQPYRVEKIRDFMYFHMTNSKLSKISY